MVGKDLVDRIKSAVDIAEVARKYIKLNQKGGDFWACCPFHSEKTPSFKISTERQMFKCFGCGKGGDVFALLKELDMIDFPEAVEQLAAQAGIVIESHERRGDGRRQRILDTMKAATRHFRERLKSDDARAVREYLDRRGLDSSTQDRFSIGFAADAWHDLHHALSSAGYSDEELVRAGLLKQNDRGQVYDLFRNRVIIPIRDVRGRVIAFGGRILDEATSNQPGSVESGRAEARAGEFRPNDPPPKYVNSPETELFSKKDVLFGFDVARKSAASEQSFLVMEGYMDVLAAHQKGISNAVGVLGTALTANHAQAINRHAERAILLFDADEGGRRAADRGAPILLEEGIDVTVVTLPEGLDPDDFLNSRGVEAFWEHVESSGEDLLEFFIRRAREKHRGGGAGATARAAREVLGLVGRTADVLQRTLLIRRIGQAFNLDEADLRSVPAPNNAIKGQKEEESRVGIHHRAKLQGWECDEIFVLQQATMDSALAIQVVDRLTEENFQDQGKQMLFTLIRECCSRSQSTTASAVKELAADEPVVLSALDEVLGREFPPEENLEDALVRMGEYLKKAEYERQKEEASLSGVLDGDSNSNSNNDDDDRELDRILREGEGYHKDRYQRSKVSHVNRRSDGNEGS